MTLVVIEASVDGVREGKGNAVRVIRKKMVVKSLWDLLAIKRNWLLLCVAKRATGVFEQRMTSSDLCVNLITQAA